MEASLGYMGGGVILSVTIEPIGFLKIITEPSVAESVLLLLFR